MKTIEEQAFCAMLDGDFEAAREALEKLLPGELSTVIRACTNLKQLAWEAQAEAENK